MQADLSSLTYRIACQIERAHWSDLPKEVSEHALSAFVNFVGCAAAGSRHDAVDFAERALSVPGSSGTSAVIGRPTQTHDQLSALLNAIGASVYAYDDTHAEAIVHPSSIVGSALVAMAGTLQKVDGPKFLLSFAWGLEVMCRLSKALSVTPAKADIGWSQSGVTGAIGAAVACGKLLDLNPTLLCSAIGIAASLSSGLRVAHGTMTMHLVPAQAAATGVQAVKLAINGFTGPNNALEGRNGFLSLFAKTAHIPSLEDDLGKRFELLSIGFKAYPCGIVIHAVIDACLQIRSQHALDLNNIASVCLLVPELTVALADRREPRTEFEAQVSVQHWAAATLLQGVAGIKQGMQETIDDDSVRTLRNRCQVIGIPNMDSDAAEIQITLVDGKKLSFRVDHGIGSLENPLTDEQIDFKFLNQVRVVLGESFANELLRKSRLIASIDDVANIWADHNSYLKDT